jgi:hypothetical protein
MSLDLKRILGKDEGLEDVAYWPGAVQYKLTVPAYQFVRVVGPLSGADLFLLISARDSFDEELCRSIFNFVDARVADVSLEREVTILDGLHREGIPFDAVLLLSGSCQSAFATVDEELDRRTVAAFPIARCEFTGNEIPEDIDQIRRQGPDIIKWKRELHAFALVRSRNEDRDPITLGSKKPYYLSELSVVDQILKLPEDNSSFVEVENFLGQHIRLVVRARKFAIAFGDRQVYIKKVKFGAEQVAVAKADIERWIHDFLTRGLPTPRK